MSNRALVAWCGGALIGLAVGGGAGPTSGAEDAARGRRIAADVLPTSHPVLADRRILWVGSRDGSPQVYLYDLDYPQRGARRLTPMEARVDASQGQLQIVGDTVVWVDTRQGYPQLYQCHYRAETGECPEECLSPEGARQHAPQVSGHVLVAEDVTTPRRPALYMYELDVPDLMISQVAAVSADAEASTNGPIPEGTPLTLTVRVRNAGSQATNPTTLAVLIDSQLVSEPVAVPALVVGQEYVWSSSSAWAAVVGSHRLTARVDGAGLVAEANEGNNTAQQLLEVAPVVPTLLFGAGPTTLEPGQPAVMFWKATRATACEAGGAWSGRKPLRGPELVTFSGDHETETFELTCTGVRPEVSVSRSVTLHRGSAPSAEQSAKAADLSGSHDTPN